jgi:hypothetical protein
VGCLRLISGNRAWQDSTTLSKSERALFSTSTGCVSCRWTTHLTPNKGHFPQMQALGAKEHKVPAGNSTFIAIARPSQPFLIRVARETLRLGLRRPPRR